MMGRLIGEIEKKKFFVFFFKLLPFANLTIENLLSGYLKKYYS